MRVQSIIYLLATTVFVAFGLTATESLADQRISAEFTGLSNPVALHGSASMPVDQRYYGWRHGWRAYPYRYYWPYYGPNYGGYYAPYPANFCPKPMKWDSALGQWVCQL